MANMYDYLLKKQCSHCNQSSLIIDNRSGDVICSGCGDIFVGRFMNSGSEENVYAEDQENGRKLTRSSGLAESLGSTETILVAGPESERKALERANKLTVNRKEHAVLSHLFIVNELCTRLNLTPSIKAKTVELFTEVLLHNHVRCKSKEILASSCIYLACRLCGYPRVMEEIVLYTNIPSSDKLVHQYAGLIMKRMNLPVPPITAKAIINRMISSNTVICSWFTYREKRYCEDMIKGIEEYGLFEGYPPLHSVIGVILWVIVITAITTNSTNNSTNNSTGNTATSLTSTSGGNSPNTSTTSSSSIITPAKPSSSHHYWPRKRPPLHHISSSSSLSSTTSTDNNNNTDNNDLIVVDIDQLCKQCFVSTMIARKMYSEIYEILPAIIPRDLLHTNTTASSTTNSNDAEVEASLLATVKDPYPSQLDRCFLLSNDDDAAAASASSSLLMTFVSIRNWRTNTNNHNYHMKKKQKIDH